ncbi:hypothetical protein E8E11_009877 [Didymella keratinophila]|nr:hypothetical protein E8E11_009877 [Didymella keratinophila]
MALQLILPPRSFVLKRDRVGDLPIELRCTLFIHESASPVVPLAAASTETDDANFEVYEQTEVRSHRYYNVDELNTLSAAYPNLEVLCISLVDLEDDINHIVVLQDFVITAENGASNAQIELRKTLEAIASFKKLRTFRIISYPLMESEDFEQRSGDTVTNSWRK